MVGFERWIQKIAVVTGASTGIGAAIAGRLVSEGMQVVGLARRSENVDKLAQNLSSEKGKLYGVKCDVTSEEDVVKAFQWTSDNLGPVQVLVNNAGTSEISSLVDGEAQKWKNVFDVNVFGLMMATREAAKIMKRTGLPGHVIHMNSLAGHYNLYYPDVAAYTASKHAVTSLSELYRKEFDYYKLPIKITDLSPGLVDTDIVKDNFGDKMAKSPKLLKEDVTDAIMYILSTRPEAQVHHLMIRPVGEIPFRKFF